MIKERKLTREQKFSYWGDGPWCDEFDFVEFLHEGRRCLIRRIFAEEPFSKDLHVFGGHFCGYCEILEGEIGYNKQLDSPDLYDLSVHGGITFTGDMSDGFFVGFDCAHSGDIIPSMVLLRKELDLDEKIKEIKEMQKKMGYRLQDVYRDLSYVITETKDLAEQINKLNGKENDKKS